MFNRIKDLYNVAQVREFDRIAINNYKISGFALMQRAGQEVFNALRANWPKAKKLTVVCGKGNNAGDGYIVASLAKKAKLKVTVLYLTPPEKLTGDAAKAYNACKSHKVLCKKFNTVDLYSAEIIVDAIFGTGLNNTITGEYYQAISAINNSGIPVLAIDVPSGLNANTGIPWGISVQATLTVTLVAPKQGLFTGLAHDYCGQIICHDLNIPAAIFKQAPKMVKLLDLEEMSVLLPKRKRTAYKNNFGHVLVIGGDYGMAGAIRMAAEAAARTGAGLVTVATRPEHIAAVSGACPELMCYGITSAEDLSPLIDQATVIVAGPGLGKNSWGKKLLHKAISSNKPLLLDADALNLLADLKNNQCKNNNWIFTPHPGEAARLLNCSISEIQNDRFAAIRKLQECYKATVVLKGAGSLVTISDKIIGICSAGNPGMASGGMGDILSGVIGGLLAQELSLENAATLGTLMHASAGDLAAKKDGERGLLATDLLPYLRHLANLKR